MRPFCFRDAFALFFQKPFKKIVSLNFPSPQVLIFNTPYVAGFNNYIYYQFAPASGVSFDTTFSVVGLPVGLVENTTITGTINWIISGAGLTFPLTTRPIHTDSVMVYNDTLSTTISLQITDIASPVYTIGTAIYKFIISINLE